MLVSFVYNLFNSLAEWNSHGLIKFIHVLLWQKSPCSFHQYKIYLIHWSDGTRMTKSFIHYLL
ncbi:hypothetical protein SAMN05444380_10887 [Thermophagus xiamenensis]|uniref:Uncharacterized protein n=1 Tax=Thermophagus xiamenensis TaxID=385682 RepID=A0A1I1YV29_9BACT|nr:hypothetical protein SAMN05444380_10887 [Thermophagus xiamenensis]